MKIISYHIKFLLIVTTITSLNKAQDITWTRKADLPTGRWLGAAVVCNNNIYILGGRGPEQWAIYEYSPLTDEWNIKSFFPDYFTHGLIAHLAVGAIGNKIYVVGGTDKGNTIRFDPATDQWQTFTPIPTLRYHTTFCVLKNELHVIGGSFSRDQPATEHEVYNPQLNTWQEKSPVQSGGNAIVINDKLYLIGGMDLDTSNISQVRLYNADKDTWNKICDAPIPPLGSGLAAVGKSIYAIGGQTNKENGEEKVTADIFKYNIDSNNWMQINTFPQKIQFSQTTVIRNKIYVIGGCDENYNVYNSVWCGEVTSQTGSDYLGQTPPGDTPEVFAPGIVSTIYMEHSAPTFSPDGNEVFWLVRKGFISDPDLVVLPKTMKRIEGKWTKPIDSPYGGSPFFSPDGKRLYFSHLLTSDNPDGPYFVENQGDGWSKPKNIGLVERFTEIKSVHNPTITCNGTLYFACDTAGLGMYKDHVIYKTELVNGEYTKPELLPSCINLQISSNYTPFIAPDESYLIFSSNRPGSLDNNGDLYISFHNRNKDTWSEPVNLGEPINSRGQECSPGVSPDGKYLFYTSPNKGQQSDIFWVSTEIIEKLKNKTFQKQNFNSNTAQEKSK